MQGAEFTLVALFPASGAGLSRFPHAEFLLSVAAPAQFPKDDGAEVAFAGRSNAGKSSALNAIAGRKALARTSKTPGRTRLLNYFDLAPGGRIVDLPGYGYAEVPPDERRIWVPLIDALRARSYSDRYYAWYRDNGTDVSVRLQITPRQKQDAGTNRRAKHPRRLFHAVKHNLWPRPPATRP